ncbi:hypothetical protein SS50377_23384 [Spironucleus salmonicida]|uniref:Uncharacterized protein n=1 Tax=Spironucleus salmonicida TaxID=348837 RepID=A0A9P8LW81_9EUKA|nr:hypothetical protein SS50377_23384 [Spironucleus salmonicida]
MQYLDFYLKTCNFKGIQPYYKFISQLQQYNQHLEIDLFQIPIFQTLQKMKPDSIVITQILIVQELLDIFPDTLCQIKIHSCSLTISPKLLQGLFYKLQKIRQLTILSCQLSDNFFIELAKTKIQLHFISINSGQITLKGVKALVRYLENLDSTIHLHLERINLTDNVKQYLIQQTRQCQNIIYFSFNNTIVKNEQEIEPVVQQSEKLPLPVQSFPDNLIKQQVDNIEMFLQQYLKQYEIEFNIKYSMYHTQTLLFQKVQEQVKKLCSSYQQDQQQFIGQLESNINNLILQNEHVQQQKNNNLQQLKSEKQRLELQKQSQLQYIDQLTQNNYTSVDIQLIKQRINKIKQQIKNLQKQK